MEHCTKMGNANQKLTNYGNKMSPITCQSFIVKQIKQNDGDPWPGQDQGHNQQPGHWWAEGHNHFVQKRRLIWPSWRGRLPALHLTAHWSSELRKKKGWGRGNETLSNIKLQTCWSEMIKCDISVTIRYISGMIIANSAPCGDSQQCLTSIKVLVMT